VDGGGGAMRVNEVYDRLTVQGEGPHTGRLCTFVRLYGCNLHCAWCDTPYTWDTKGRNGTVFAMADERHDMPVAEVVKRVLATDAPICVVSGGEPLLQYRDVIELAYTLRDYDVETHVETNGTVSPAYENWIAHYTVSPKLPSAQAGQRAIDLDVLHEWARHDRAVFKIVCCSVFDVRAAADLYDKLQLPQVDRWVMPEAVTAAELDERLPHLIDTAVEHGLNVTTRLHVQAWGTQRGR
jgi:7-carboxy-7-deazaguanine synthase